MEEKTFETIVATLAVVKDSARGILDKLLSRDFVFFLLGVAATAIVYYLGKNTKKPGYVIKTMVVLNEKSAQTIKDLDIRVLGAPIKNLALTKIAFLNAGRKTINKDDLAKPIIITVKRPTELLRWGVLYQSEENNCLAFDSVKDNDQSGVRITFDYLDKNDGFVLMLVHTGNTNDDFTLEGKIKGVKKFWRLAAPSPTESFRTRNLNPLTIAMNVGLWFGCLLGFIFFLIFLSDSKSELVFALGLVGLPLLMGIFMMIASLFIATPVRVRGSKEMNKAFLGF